MLPAVLLSSFTAVSVSDSPCAPPHTITEPYWTLQQPKRRQASARHPIQERVPYCHTHDTHAQLTRAARSASVSTQAAHSQPEGGVKKVVAIA